MYNFCNVHAVPDSHVMRIMIIKELCTHVLQTALLFVIVIVIVMFTSSALEGIHRRQIKPVRVFTCSQGNLEAKGMLAHMISMCWPI